MAAGFVGGILGGMGMGGGTLLIPILTILLTVFQHEAQGINLISFVPMAIVTVVMHAKNKMIDWRLVLYVVIPAVVTSILSSLFSAKLSQSVLSTSFGIFLILLGIFQIVCEITKVVKGKVEKSKDSVRDN